VGDLIAEGTSVAPSRESHETVEEETRDVTIGKVVEGIKSSYQLRNNLIIDLSRARDELREVKERYQNVFEEAKALLARSEALQRREKDLHEKIIAVTQNMDEYQKDLVDLQGKRGAEVTNRIRGAHITSSTTSGTVSHASVTPKGDKWSIVIYVDSLVPGFPAREIHIEDTYESYESAWNAVDEWVGQNGTYAQW
jgi:myosin heavy subunit